MKDTSMRSTGNPMEVQFVYRGQVYRDTLRFKVVGLTNDRNECPACDELFRSVSAFDKHRVGDYGKDRRCLTPEEMIAKGMAKNEAGFWVSSPFNREKVAKVFGSNSNV